MQIFCYNIKVQSREQTNYLIQQSVEEYFKGKNICFEKINVLRTEKGKPYIENSDIHIGVTHTEDLVMIGVCKTPFGIDAEKKDRKIRQKENIAKKFFSKNEIKLALKSDEEFLKLWVKKEAFVKYTGQGIGKIKEVDTLALNGYFKEINFPGYISYVYSSEKIDCEIINKFA